MRKSIGVHSLLVLLFILLSGCGEPVIDVPDAIPAPAPGVALDLARQRAQAIGSVVYDVRFDLPEDIAEPVTGEVSVQFELADTGVPLVLDFKAPAEHVLDVRFDNAAVDYELAQDHIVIPAAALSTGQHSVQVVFRSTDAALNRQAGVMYALFVPDRASTAFPVFEQPNLKGRFNLTLGIPPAWQAVANGELLARDTSNPARHVLHFAATQPLSTYLFSFAAGELQVATAMRDGRQLTMYHRETDADKLARNREILFDLHAASLRWLEDYTGIPYPFDKIAFFAIPAFQFGGMEHPGAVWYRAESLFLDPSASRTQELSRASLIAHETTHMWFGDLVTMDWFNDVWMKEVFANFMAAKIAGPAFPDLNLDLRFFQANHPTAYNVDRTAGTNPIRQELDNLNDAGSLYGAIIYQKAPIVVRQLEALLGEEALRDGLRLYLDSHQYGNATWPDLIRVLDPLTEIDLNQWSQVGVNASGRHEITTGWGDGGITVRQIDTRPQRNLLWSQPLVVAVGSGGKVTEYSVQLEDAEAFIPIPQQTAPDFILAGADGIGYGRFILDSVSRDTLLAGVNELPNPVHRAVAWQTLWEETLDNALSPVQFAEAVLVARQQEPEELITQQLQGWLRHDYWQFMTDPERRARSAKVEAVLWDGLEKASTPGSKGAYFNTIISVTLSAAGIERLQRIWLGEETPEGLPLLERQYSALAEALALRYPDAAVEIFDVQEQRITNPDRRERFRLIRPAYTGGYEELAAMLARFQDVAVRRQESWVLDAMGGIHHPMRNEASIEMLRSSLDLTEEILNTGDIFFPLNWLNATLGGYASPQAVAIVRAYLDANPELPPRLRGKVLQAADDLFRVASRP